MENKYSLRRVLRLEPDQPRVRVLIVDDNDDIRRLLVSSLGSVGFELREATNGAESIEQFDAWKPQLILMDMRMEVMDGAEAIQCIRDRAGDRDVKIITLTASAFEEERQHALAVGANDFLGKPFRIEELFEKIKTLLEVKYVYANEVMPEPQSSSNALPMPAVSRRIDRLPQELTDQLRQATIEGDLDRLLELIGRVACQDVTLALELRKLAQGFQYRTLTSLLTPG